MSAEQVKTVLPSSQKKSTLKAGIGRDIDNATEAIARVSGSLAMLAMIPILQDQRSRLTCG